VSSRPRPPARSLRDAYAHLPPLPSCSVPSPSKFGIETHFTPALAVLTVRSDCSEGRFSAGGLQPCHFCKPGQFQPNRGKANCLPIVGWTPPKHIAVCKPGRYKDPKSDHTVCDRCEPGQFSDFNDAMFCKPCHPGRFGVGGSKTGACSGECPAGHLCGPGSTSPSDTGYCPTGTWMQHLFPTLDACASLIPVFMAPGRYTKPDGMKVEDLNCDLSAPVEYQPSGAKRTLRRNRL
jgi:hypothetical protein